MGDSTCSECDAEIGTLRTSCPQCGAAHLSGRSRARALLVLFGAILMLMAAAHMADVVQRALPG